MRAARQASGISQEELAHRAGLHRTFISQLERGVKSPTLTTMDRVAGALGVPLASLLAALDVPSEVPHVPDR